MSWIQSRVLDAVGIHMSMPPKNKSKNTSGAGKPVAGDDEDVEQDISGWTPPPHVLAAWVRKPEP